MRYRKIQINRTFLVVAILLITFSCHSQTLKRKGSLGIEMKNAREGVGITVLKILENTTASKIGILADDVIISINSKSYNDVNDLVDIVATWRENDEIIVTLERKKEKLNLSGNVIAKPYETSENGSVIYGAVDFDGGLLRSILTLPKDIKNPPVLLYLPGVGCSSYDFGSNPNSTVKLLVESLLKKGIAVFRMEKPGMGDSAGTKHCLEMDFDYEVAAYKKALEVLKMNTNIDANNIFLYGESLGTITAPLIADTSVAGIIAWGGFTTTWFEYYMKLQREQKTLLGIDYEDMDNEFRKTLPFYYDFMVKKLTPDELAQNSLYEAQVNKDFKGELWHGLHHYTYFQNLNDKNVLSEYKLVKCPVLALAGEHDIHTANTVWSEILADAINYYNPDNGQFRIVKEATHHYYKVPSIKEYVNMLQNNELNTEYMSKNFSEDIAIEVSNWIKSQKDKLTILKLKD